MNSITAKTISSPFTSLLPHLFFDSLSKISIRNSKIMSISTKFTPPQSFFHHSTTPLIKILSLPSTPFKFSFFYKPITIQRIPTKQVVFSTPPSVSLQPIEDLPPKLQEIVKLFQGVQDSKAKYEQLLYYGRNLNPLESKYKTNENKVQGCVSQVWVRAYLDDDKNVIFEADSDSVLTKGLAALLVQGLSGRPVEEIVKVSPDFAVLLGLQQSLTPSRNNGFLNMLKLMQKKALQLYVQADKADNSISNDFVIGKNPLESSDLELIGDVEKVESRTGSKKDLGSGSLLGSRGMRMKDVLEKELRPVELQVEDISYQHAGHAGVRGSDDGETHFNVKVVSEEFEGKSLVKRHRLIYGILQDELQSGLHALSIEAKTPAEIGNL